MDMWYTSLLHDLPWDYAKTQVLDAIFKEALPKTIHRIRSHGMNADRLSELVHSNAISSVLADVESSGELPDDRTLTEALRRGIEECKESRPAWSGLRLEASDLMQALIGVIEATPDLLATARERRLHATLETQTQAVKNFIDSGVTKILDAVQANSGSPAMPLPTPALLLGDGILPPALRRLARAIQDLLERGDWRQARITARALRQAAASERETVRREVESAITLAEGVAALMRNDRVDAELRFKAADDGDDPASFMWLQHLRLLNGADPAELLELAVRRKQRSLPSATLDAHIAFLHLLLKDLPAAREALGAESTALHEPFALKVWVALHQRENDCVAARKAAKLYLRFARSDPDAWFNFASALRASVRGDTTMERRAARKTALRAAERCFGRAAELYGTAFYRDFRVRSLCEQSVCRVELGRTTACMGPVRSAADTAPLTAPATQFRWHVAMGEAATSARQWPLAAEHWRAALALADPGVDTEGVLVAGLRIALAQVCWNQADHDGAARALEAVRRQEVQGQQAFTYARIDVALRVSGDCSDRQVAEWLGQLRADFGRSMEGVEEFCGQVWGQRERFDLAAAAFHRATELEPNNHASWYVLAQAEALGGKYGDAYAAVCRAMEIERRTRTPAVEAFELAIGIAQRLRDHAQIIEWCTEALRLFPDQTSFYRARALASYERDDFAAAACDFRTFVASEANPEPDVLRTFADSLVRVGAYVEACAAWRRVERATPEDAVPAVRIVNTLIMSGNRDAAWAEMGRALHRFPGHPGVRGYASQFAAADGKDDRFLASLLPGADLRPLEPSSRQSPVIVPAGHAPEQVESPMYERAWCAPERPPFVVFARGHFTGAGATVFRLATTPGAPDRDVGAVVAAPVALMLIHDLEIEDICVHAFGQVLFPQEWIEELHGAMFARNPMDAGTLLKWTFSWMGTFLQVIPGSLRDPRPPEAITGAAIYAAKRRGAALLVAEEAVARQAKLVGIRTIALATWIEWCREREILDQPRFEQIQLNLFARGGVPIRLTPEMFVAVLRTFAWDTHPLAQRVLGAIANPDTDFEPSKVAGWLRAVWNAAPDPQCRHRVARDLAFAGVRRLRSPQDVLGFCKGVAAVLRAGDVSDVESFKNLLRATALDPSAAINVPGLVDALTGALRS